MRKNKLGIVLLASSLSLSSILTVYGQDEKAVTSIPLTITWDKRPRPGEWVGNIYAKTSSSQFIIDGAVYYKEEDVWFSGEKPVVEVDLSAKEGYRFSDIDKSSFSLYGCNAEYKGVTVEGDGSSLTLQVYLPEIEGSLPTTTGTGWNGNMAVWDAVEGAKSYEIKLYNGSVTAATIITSETSYDLSLYINRDGVYTFNVRAIGSYQTQASPWSESSGTYTITPEDAWYISNGSWQDTSSGWRYIYENGAYPSDTWRCIDQKWYYFDQQGYMVTNCYVKAPGEENYRWIGGDGIWDPQEDTSTPDADVYKIIA